MVKLAILSPAFVAALLTTAATQYPNPPQSAPAETGEWVLFVMDGPTPGTTVERPALVIRGFGPGTTAAELHVFRSIMDTTGWPTFQPQDVPHHDARFEPGASPTYSWHRLQPKFAE